MKILAAAVLSTLFFFPTIASAQERPRDATVPIVTTTLVGVALTSTGVGLYLSSNSHVRQHNALLRECGPDRACSRAQLELHSDRAGTQQAYGTMCVILGGSSFFGAIVGGVYQAVYTRRQTRATGERTLQVTLTPIVHRSGGQRYQGGLLRLSW